MFIADLSNYQKLAGPVNFDVLKTLVDAVILKDQFGYTKPDPAYAGFVAECKRVGLPFSTYAFFDAVNALDAVKEADADAAKMEANPGSRIAVIDVETMCTGIKTPNAITQAVNAYYDELKKKDFQTVWLYSYESFYLANLNTAKKDGLWLAKYNNNDGNLFLSARPATPCQLWQFTSRGLLKGAVNGDVDLSVVLDSSIAETLTGIQTVPPAVKVEAASTVKEYCDLVVDNVNFDALEVVYKYVEDRKWKRHITENVDETFNLKVGLFDKSTAAYNGFKAFLEQNKYKFSEIPVKL